MDDEVLLETENLVKTFGTFRAVDGLNIKVRAGEMQVALILNPTALSDVITIAENDEKMPRKSTHFYPKPVSGLVFYPMDEAFHAPG